MTEYKKKGNVIGLSEFQDDEWSKLSPLLDFTYTCSPLIYFLLLPASSNEP